MRTVGTVEKATPPPAPPRRRGALADRWWGRLLLRGGTLAALLGAWQLAGDDSLGLGFPTFTRTLAALAELLGDGAFYQALWATNQALLLGFALAIVVAVPLGVLIGTVRLADQVASPYLNVLVAVPIIAFIPVVQVVFGLTMAGRVAIVFLFSFAYVAVNCAVGVRRADPALREMARSFLAGRFALLREVALPAAVPGIMAGVRIGLGQALIGMVIAELALVGAGIGSMITDLQGKLRVAPVLAITLVVVLEGVVLLTAAERVERRLSRWRGTDGGQS